MLKSLLVRAGLAVLGVAVMLAWWSFRGSDGKSSTVQQIPAKVWNGGAGTLTIEIETTCAARVSINFEEHEEAIESRRNLGAWEKVGTGVHSWTIDVPAKVGGYIDLTAENPKVGDKLSWRIKLNNQVVDEQSQTLEEALKPNYAFGLQAFYQEYASAQKEEDED